MLLNAFEGFASKQFATTGASINAVIGGNGPPLLLLHGWPQNYLEWHRIAQRLAKNFTVVATDLRGYGDSSKPADGEDHFGYCKRATAADQVEVMTQLGFEHFSVVGHDRGGRVAHRMALDHSQRVQRLVLIDIVPTLKVYSTVDKQLATAYFHWFFLIQPAPLPEKLLKDQGEIFLRRLFHGLDEQAMPKNIFSEYVRCFNTPSTLHAMCEDYRAAASIDLQHDKADLDRKVECPTLILWGEHGAMHKQYDVLATWRERCAQVTGYSLPGGHWLPEQLPDETYRALQDFLSSEAKWTHMHFKQIELRNDPAAREYLKDEVVQVIFAKQSGAVASREGANRYAIGDALITGSTGDCWSVSRDRFDAKYLAVTPLLHGQDGAYRNKPMPVWAKQIEQDFSVQRAVGSDVIHGRAKDWLMQYAPGDYGIVENAKFQIVYRAVK